jgi:DNA polymerase III delta prime subunit
MQPDAGQFQLPQDDAGARLHEAHRDGHGQRRFRHGFLAQPEAAEETLPPLELADQHLIISCDATQASAIARARTGASYIIQGPPGTGKSQTITNLIADYVARGKRVLFVCEKRAAIDVVFPPPASAGAR